MIKLNTPQDEFASSLFNFKSRLEDAYLSVRLFSITIFLLASSMTYAQTWTGSTNPVAGVNYDYSFNNNNTVYVAPGWVIANGAIQGTPYTDGTTYFVTVQWTGSGAGSVSFKNKTTIISTLNVTICSPPAAPTGSFTYTSQCSIQGNPASVIITRTGSPPGGVDWHWFEQYGSTSLGIGSSITALAFQTYVLRSYSAGCWGSGELTAVTIPGSPNSVTTGVNVCGGNATTLTAGGTSLRWYDACSGGNLVGTGNSFTTPALYSSVSYYVCQFSSGIEGPRAQAFVNLVSTPVAVSASASPMAVCGSGTVTLSTTGNEANTAYYWYTVASGGTALPSNTPFVSAPTTYFVGGTNISSGCQGPRNSVSITINPVPGAPTASNAVFCGSASITATPGSNANTVNWYSAPTGGSPVTSTTSPVAHATTTWFITSYNTTTGCESTAARLSVMVTINPIPGAPSASNATFCGSGSITPTLGSNANTIRWYDALTGGSLLLTSTSSGTISSTTTRFITSYNDLTFCESTAARLPVTITINPLPGAPTATSAAFCGSGSITPTIGSNANTIRWYDALTGGSLLLTATSSGTVTSTINYFITSFNTTTGCESTTARLPVTITINPIPGAPTATSATFCGSGSITPTLGSNANTIRWYNALTGGSLVLTGTSSGTISTTTPFYITSYNTTTGCESAAARLPVTITINPIPGAPTATNATFCGSGSITPTLGSNANTIRWYNALTGGSLVLTGTSSGTISTTTPFYITSYNATTGCESTAARIPVTITINPIPGAPSATNATFCGSGSITPTLGSNANTIRWYNALTGGSLVLTGTSSGTVSTTTPFYITSYNTTTGCESTAARLPVTITINPIPGAPTATSATFCGSGSITPTLGANATTIRWYNALTGGSLVLTGTTSGTISTTTPFYITSYNATTGCESTAARLPVTITINPIPGAPSASNATFCGSGSITPTLGSNANTIRWYNALTGGSLVLTGTSSGTISTTTPYYITSYNTTTGCESSPRLSLVVTVNPVPVVVLSGSALLVYGNPTTLSTGSFYSYQWKRNGVNITSAIQQNFIADGPGDISVGTKISAGDIECVSLPKVLTTTFTSQATSLNMVSSTAILREGITDFTSLYTLQPNEIQQVISYQDGIGRTFQEIGVGLGPDRGDLVTTAGFGKHGLAETSYMPYNAGTTDGRYRRNALRDTITDTYGQSEQYLFYQNSSKVAHDTYPYAKTVYRDEPGARVIEQGAPGADWQPGASPLTGLHTVKSLVAVNNATYPVRFWKADGTTTGNYPVNSVMVSIATDENNNQVRTFTNMLGQTVLKQVQLGETIAGTLVNWLDTYYIYDNYGRLAYQVPPLAMKTLTATSVNVTTVPELIYQYTYDGKGRLVEKKEPGTTPQYIIYDNLDRVVLTQDANLRTINSWQFIKYDYLNRPVYSGIYRNNTQLTRTAVQALFDPIDYNVSPRFETELINATTQGYSNTVFPTTGSVALTILKVNYYDHYNFDRDNLGTADYVYDNAHLPGTPSTARTATRGLPTGSRIKTINDANTVSTTWLTSVVFYDDFERPLQTISNNYLNSALQDKGSVLYDFTGHILKTKATHATSAAVDVTQRYTYDASWRTLGIFHTINNNAEQQLASYTYNALGQMVDKKLHVNGGTFLQSVDYRYNIRGWLASINNAQLTTDANTNDDTNDYFGMELVYNTDAGLSNTKQYNGNISSLIWKGPGKSGISDQRSYSYLYDKSDKLETATFQANTGLTWTQEAGTLNEAMTYDHNGNILSLQRQYNQRSVAGVNSAQPLDNLTYTYTTKTNRMIKVEDAVPVTTGIGDFKNGSTVTTEYTYQTSGSLKGDANKGISLIDYNLVGKPRKITYSGTPAKTIKYTYDAAGTKLKMVTYDGTTTTTIDYVGRFVYTNSVLSFFSSPEGRVVKNGANYEYQYAIADHQGNTRVVFTSATPAAQPTTADMEAVTNGSFQNYTNRTNFDLMDHTDAGTGYTYSQKLTSASSEQVGLSKSFKVYAGDKVKVEAFAKYFNPQSTAGNISGFAGALLSAFGLAPPIVGETGTAASGLDNWGGLVAAGNSKVDNGFPKAYVNIVVFDKNYKFLDVAYQQIDGGEQPVGNGTKLPHDFMSSEYTAKEEGYVFVYLSNENPTLIETYFDDVTMTYTPGNVIQYNEFYNHGLPNANSWTRQNNAGNNFLGNGGTELNGLSNLYDLDYRNYDPVLGRMHGVDPMASKYASHTPYNFAFNDPVSFNDPSGADPLYNETTRAAFGETMQGGYFKPHIMDNGVFGGAGTFGGTSNITNPGFSSSTWSAIGGTVNNLFNNTNPYNGEGVWSSSSGTFSFYSGGQYTGGGAVRPIYGSTVNGTMISGASMRLNITRSIIGYKYVAQDPNVVFEVLHAGPEGGGWDWFKETVYYPINNNNTVVVENAVIIKYTSGYTNDADTFGRQKTTVFDGLGNISSVTYSKLYKSNLMKSWMNDAKDFHCGGCSFDKSVVRKYFDFILAPNPDHLDWLGRPTDVDWLGRPNHRRKNRLMNGATVR